MESIHQLLEKVKHDISFIDFEGPVHLSQSVSDYLNYYDLFWDDITHHLGWFTVKRQKLMAHIFVPKNPRGTIIYHHGYTDHSASGVRLIRHLLNRNYVVAAYDALGHGLSDGERGFVHDFSVYLSCLESFIGIANSELPKPLHLLGHSLGGAVSKEYLFRHGDHDIIDQTILLAPLVRLKGSPLIQLKYKLIHKYVDKVPRKIKKISSDPRIRHFLNKWDPLQVRHIPLAWVKAYYTWYRRAHSYGISDRSVYMIQGDKDLTVDWKYNSDFIEEKFPGSDILIIKGARHALLGEIEDYWLPMIARIDQALGC